MTEKQNLRCVHKDGRGRSATPFAQPNERQQERRSATTVKKAVLAVAGDSIIVP
jgi:hypothetical protein